jgi:AraC-like DNA-binding protein
MQRSLSILAIALAACVGLFFTGHRATEWLCMRHFARPADDLDWLRMRFGLSDGELTRVRQLHEGYLPICRQWCEQIDARKQELLTALRSSSNAAPIVEKKLLEIGTLRAQCHGSMLRHFREVSEVMPPEQGREYLAEMQRLTLGFHEQFERSMPGQQTAPHGHR